MDVPRNGVQAARLPLELFSISGRPSEDFWEGRGITVGRIQQLDDTFRHLQLQQYSRQLKQTDCRCLARSILGKVS